MGFGKKGEKGIYIFWGAREQFRQSFEENKDNIWRKHFILFLRERVEQQANSFRGRRQH